MLYFIKIKKIMTGALVPKFQAQMTKFKSEMLQRLRMSILRSLRFINVMLLQFRSD